MLLSNAAFAADDEVTTVILVRHGQTDYNKMGRWQGCKFDMPLNETGLEQARLLADSLKDTQIDVFISSPLQRAYTTTKICADAQDKWISYADFRFRDMDLGEWSGLTETEIAEKYPKLFKAWSEKPWKYKIPGGESLQDMQRCYREALDDAADRYHGKVIFIGAHSFCNATLLCDLLGMRFDHLKYIRQDNTCANVLERRNGEWHVVMINSVSHLGYLYKGAKKRAA